MSAPSGFLNIIKPLDITSHDVVSRVRRVLGTKKVGHAGTLDPLASGVLPIAVGNATRLLEFLPSDKRYRARMTLGAITETWDREAELMPVASAADLTQETLTQALLAMQGELLQTVPPHAAVHVNGKKLYEYARKGIKVDLPERTTTIHAVEVVGFEDLGTDMPSVIVDIHCASGTYIRSMAWALGQQFGVGGYLSALERTQHGRFGLDTAISLEDFQNHAEPRTCLLNPVEYCALPLWQVNDPVTLRQLVHGQKIQPEAITDERLRQSMRNEMRILAVHEGEAFAVCKAEETGRIKPLKVLGSLEMTAAL